MIDRPWSLSALSAGARHLFENVLASVPAGVRLAASHLHGLSELVRRVQSAPPENLNPGPDPRFAFGTVESMDGLLMQADTGGNMIVILGRNAALAAIQSLPLSKRDAEVLSWIQQGKGNAEIAILLGISTRTVEECEIPG